MCSWPIPARLAMTVAMPVLLTVGLPVGALAESIVTGGKTGTYYVIGNNLRDIVSPALEVKDSKGSWANVEDLSQTPGVSLAIVQSDVYAAFVHLRDSRDVPEATRQQYQKLLENLRVFMPLYKEEIHFLVRKDSGLDYMHQIRGKRMWMDIEKSGTYLTALNIYSKMFGERPAIVDPFINPTVTGDDEGTKKRRSALMALSDPAFYHTYPKIDVVVLVGGQPLKLLEKSIPPNLKLLKFDPAHASSEKLLQDYKQAEIQKASYPLLNIVGDGQPSLAVDSYMITADFANPERNKFISNFAVQFCQKFGDLQSRGHQKWKALSWKPGLPLPPLAAGWKYSTKSKDSLSRCSSASAVGPTGTCSPQDRFAGLCR